MKREPNNMKDYFVRVVKAEEESIQDELDFCASKGYELETIKVFKNNFNNTCALLIFVKNK